MKISRVWAMPNKWTFKIKPIKELLERYEVGNGWADPFCGESDLCEIRNDLNPNNKKAHFHVEASKFLDDLYARGKTYKGIIFDHPYSLTQVSRSYNNMGIKGWNKNNKTGAFPMAKDTISKLVIVGGIVISFGWNSIGMGKGRGFALEEILLVCHGGNRNDTICTVERKL